MILVNGSKNIAFFQFASSQIHFATSLEILRNEYEMGNKNFYYLLGQNTTYPTRMAKSGESLLGKAPYKLKKLIYKADPDVNFADKLYFNKTWVDDYLQRFQYQLDHLSSISDLSNLSLDFLKPGSAIANEIVSLTRHDEINLLENKKIISLMLRSFLEVYSHTLITIKTHQITRIHIYNGRFLHEKAAWEAAKISNCEALIFETVHNRYQQRFEGFHSRINNQRVIKQLWENTNVPHSKKIEYSKIWFDVMKSHQNPFVVEKPIQLKIEKKFFVYFSNSDDEVVGFWDEWNQPLGSQYEVMNKLIDIFDKQEKYSLVIKLHPNLLKRPKSTIKKWKNLNLKKNSILIKPEDKISAYDLVDECVGVINFGSTIGIEAAYYKKPVLVLADCKYDELDIADKLSNWVDIESWIEQAEYLPVEVLYKRHINSLVFGFYFYSGGKNFERTVLIKDKQLGAWEAKEFLGIKVNECWVMQNYRKTIAAYKIHKIKKGLKIE